MASRDEFFNLYRHGFARVALATPLVRIGDPMANAAATLALMREAAKQKAVVAVFPELGLSAYSCEDLFHQQALLQRVRGRARLAARALEEPAASPPSSACRWSSTGCSTTAPRSSAAAGCSAWCRRPTCRTTASSTSCASSRPGGRRGQGNFHCAGQIAPFRVTDLPAEGKPGLGLFAEICEDLWVPAPPSSFAALAGRDGDRQPVGLERASSASTSTAGARRQPVGALHRRLPLQRRRARANPPPTSPGTATRMAYENGSLLAESRALRERARSSPSPTSTSSAWKPTACARTPSASRRGAMRREVARFRTVDFSLPLPEGKIAPRKKNREISLRARPTRRRATRAARRSTASRSRASPRACAPPARRSSSSASRAAWTRRRRCSSARASMDELGLPREQHPRLHHAGLRHHRRAPAPAPGS